MAILVAMANDAIQEHVLQVALDMGRKLDRELEVVRFVDDETADAEVKFHRDTLRDRLREEDVPATVSVEYVGRTIGRPNARIGKELVDLSADVDISHIVVGHSSEDFMKRLARGNAAFAVADKARVPVTVVPETIEDPSV